MRENCPHCGRPMSGRWLGAKDLLAMLSDGRDGRMVYRGAYDGQWYVSHGDGKTTDAAVKALIRQGAIRPVYSNCPTDAYHVGRTLDCERTLAARKERGRRDIAYYIGDA